GTGNGITENYFRLDRTVDRNGNALKYEYNHADPTLVTKIYDPALLQRHIDFAYQSTSDGYRLHTVTDPLGRSFEYDYTNGMLTSVLKPHPDDPAAAPQDRPKIGFDYVIDTTKIGRASCRERDEI